MISKELLSLVLNKDIYEWCYGYGKANKLNDSNVITIATESGLVEYINLDTLGRVYKEWCIKQGYCIQTDYEGIVESFGVYVICRVFYDGEVVYNNYAVYQDYQKELQAIIKATEWVAKEKGLL